MKLSVMCSDKDIEFYNELRQLVDVSSKELNELLDKYDISSDDLIHVYADYLKVKLTRAKIA